MLINNKEKCCGCGVCSLVCPQKCIAMEQDNEGFLYPKVDIKNCINCNLCHSTCPIEKYIGTESTGGGYVKAFGGWHKDDKIRFESSSGGAFSLLANLIIEQGGIVFGCTLDNELKAVHIGVDKKEDLWKLRGSKYVQSEIGNIYYDVKQMLKLNRMVMFVGTPCQVAGLNVYLGKKEYNNLVRVDFICHGVPSPKIFEGYLKQMEKEQESKIISFKFRNKDHGWNSSGLQLGSEVKFANGKRIRKYPAVKDSYMNGFLDDVYLRPSCYSCDFKRLPKNYTDFTIADFWGVNKISKTLNDGKGTSLILIHNNHANVFWNLVKKDFYYEQVDLKKAITRNKSLIYSAPKNLLRKKFFDTFEKKGYSYVARKYLSAHTWIIHKILKIGKALIKK